MEKKPIVSKLRAMKVGDVISFPLSQLGSIQNARYRDLIVLRAEGANWEIKPDLHQKAVLVTRTA